MTFGDGGVIEQRILDDLIQLLGDMTQDWDLDFADGITGRTSLVADLGFQSLDVVMLIGEIHRHYNRRNLPFDRLFVSKGGYIDDLTVADLARFLRQPLNNGAGHSGADT